VLTGRLTDVGKFQRDSRVSMWLQCVRGGFFLRNSHLTVCFRGSATLVSLYTQTFELVHISRLIQEAPKGRLRASLRLSIIYPRVNIHPNSDSPLGKFMMGVRHKAWGGAHCSADIPCASGIRRTLHRTA